MWTDPRKIVITEEMIQSVKLLKDKGFSVKNIRKELNKNSNEFKYSKGTIYNIFEKLNIKLKQKSIKNRNNISNYNENLLFNIKNMLNQKYTYIQIAEKLNISLYMVRQYLQIQNLTHKQNNNKTLPKIKNIFPEHLEFCKKMFDDKFSIADVKIKFNENFTNLNFGYKTIRKIYNQVLENKNIKNIADINCYDQKLLNDIKNLFADKKTNNEMVEILKISKHKIKLYLKIQNLTRNIKRYDINSYDITLVNNIRNLINEQKSNNDIVKILNIKIHTINTICFLFDIKRQHQTKICISKEKIYYLDCSVCLKNKIINDFNNFFDKNNYFRYITKCKDCIKENRIKNRKNLYKNINFKLRMNLSSSIYKGLKNNKSCKDGKTLEAINYTIRDLKNHLESKFEYWMTWENWGRYNLSTWDDNDSSTWKWNIDHIIPHSTFNYTSMKEQSFKDCWSLSNLRPYSAKQNILDGVTRIRHVK